jgi:hypothetical protein
MKTLITSGQIAQAGTFVADASRKTTEALPMGVVGCLKLISAGKKVVIAATSGKRTIAKAKKTFPGFLDSDFVNYGCNVPSEAKPETATEVYEMIEEDGDFRKIFGGFGVNLDLPCFTQDQIIEFVETQPDWLQQDGCATFFLYKVGKEFFVASVSVPSAGLYVYAFRFSGDDVWRAEYRHRVVVPQLAP